MKRRCGILCETSLPRFPQVLSHLVCQQEARQLAAVRHPALVVQVPLPPGHAVEGGAAAQVEEDDAAAGAAVVYAGHPGEALLP